MNLQSLGETLKKQNVQMPSETQNVAAVLVLIGFHKERKRYEILLTKRTDKVETHRGQMSFPGGFWESTDSDLLDTALRECDEEVGISKEHITVLGPMPRVMTRGEVSIYPFVGMTEFPLPLTINEEEVDKVFYLDVERLLNEGLSPVSIPIGNAQIQSYGIWLEDELVWGATARILKDLLKVIQLS